MMTVSDMNDTPKGQATTIERIDFYNLFHEPGQEDDLTEIDYIEERILFK